MVIILKTTNKNVYFLLMKNVFLSFAVHLATRRGCTFGVNLKPGFSFITTPVGAVEIKGGTILHTPMNSYDNFKYRNITI